jgi:hypothetical protein
MKLDEAMREAEDAADKAVLLLDLCRKRGVVLMTEAELLVRLSRQLSASALEIETRLKGVPEARKDFE